MGPNVGIDEQDDGGALKASFHIGSYPAAAPTIIKIEQDCHGIIQNII